MTTEDDKTPRRRRSRGKAWYWHQTDSWYYTPLGTKRRVRLFDDEGRPIRGQGSSQIAELALARVKTAGNWRPTVENKENTPWLVATVCSKYIEHCKQRAEKGLIGELYCCEITRYLNSLCSYCGALPVAELRKGHIQCWVESQTGWRSPVTRRAAITAAQAAFRHAHEMHTVSNPIHGMKKPPQRPRLYSLTEADEKRLYSEADDSFGNFLFAAIHTGLRPFCELARMTVDDVMETDRGMMWRVYSSKTKKTRKIPVRLEVAELTRRLVEAAEDDSVEFLFRNSQGNPWKKGTGVARMRRIRHKLGWDADSLREHYTCYTCRHTFAHRMLSGYWNGGIGCSIEILAELMGDTPKVVYDHYGREWGQHYQDPLWAAIGVG